MSQFCPKVNIKALRWFGSAIMRFFFYFGGRGGGGGTKHFLTFAGGYEILGGPFWVVQFLG